MTPHDKLFKFLWPELYDMPRHQRPNLSDPTPSDFVEIMKALAKQVEIVDYKLTHDSGKWECSLELWRRGGFSPYDEAEGEAATPALALVAALLELVEEG